MHIDFLSITLVSPHCRCDYHQSIFVDEVPYASFLWSGLCNEVKFKGE